MRLKKAYFLFFFLLLFGLCVSHVNASYDDKPRFEMSPDDAMKFRNGKTQLSTLQEYGKNPRYGKCWTNALEMVQEGCRRLTEDEQSRMALAFTNCHLAKLGIQESYACNIGQDFEDCVKGMSERGYIGYTEFFTHTQNICFYLQNQIWQERTENTVSRLAESSETVAEQLEVAGKMQEEMIERQNKSLQNQQEIIKHEKLVREALKSQMEDIQLEFTEMKTTAAEHKALFAEAFEKMSGLQKLVLTEFTGFYSLLFYALTALITYLLTSAPRTSGARFWMFLVLFVNISAERMIVRMTDEADVAYSWMWKCRQLFCTLAVLILAVVAYRYKDFARMNHSLLMDIRKQNSELRNFLLDFSQTSSSLQLPDNRMMKSVEGLSMQQLQLENHITHHKSLPIGHDITVTDNCMLLDAQKQQTKSLSYQGDTEFGDSDLSDDDYSFVTVMADSKPSTRSNTPLPQLTTTVEEGINPANTGLLLPYSTILEQSTPTPDTIRNYSEFDPESELSISRISNTSSFTIGESIGNTPSSPEKKKRGRPKGRKNKKSEGVTPKIVLNNSGYNLRNRSYRNTPSPASINKGKVQEMVKTAVQLNEHVTRLSSSRVPKVVTRSENPAFFSSDED